MADNDPCINGEWKNGVCVCNLGYELGFSETNLNPRYCENEIVTIINANLYVTGEELVQHIAIMVTVWLATWSVIAVGILTHSLMEKIKMKQTLSQVQEDFDKFNNERKKYENHEKLDATLWCPPVSFKLVNPK
jgi:hypothetical protein